MPRKREPSDLTAAFEDPLSNPLGNTSHIDNNTCVAVLNHALSSEQGIVNASLDVQREAVSFDFDAGILSEQEMERLALRMVPIVQERIEHCALRAIRGDTACASCAISFNNAGMAAGAIRRATAYYGGGQLSLVYDNVGRQGGLTADIPTANKHGQMQGQITAASAHDWSWLRRSVEWAREVRLEAIFTAITLVTMIAGMLASNAGVAPSVPALFYLLAYITGGAFGLKEGIESLRQHRIDVDLLMVLAALGAAIVGAPFEGAMLLFLFSLSNVLQDYAIGRTRSAIKALMKLRPNQALTRRGSRLTMLPIEQVVVGDHIIVRPGERAPLDGVVVEGESAMDQSSLTGESMPVTKQAGDKVFAGAVNQFGSLEVRVTKLAQDSTLARMIRLVEEANSEKAKTQRFLDKAEQYYAAGVIAFTALMIAIPTLLLREAFDSAFYRAMTLMVVASPCALVISTPATILSAIGNGARRGILFKGGAHLEQAANIKVVAFDKTGTLTQGKPLLTDAIAAPAATLDGWSWQGNDDELLALAAAVESRSEHPIARSIVKAAQQRHLHIPEVSNFQAVSGRGARATVNGISGAELWVGNLRFFDGLAYDEEAARPVMQVFERLEDEGKTPGVVGRISEDGKRVHFLGVVAVADALRPDAPAVVRELKALGVQRVIMMSGDHHRIARRIAAQAGIDHVYADLLPEDKVRILKENAAQHGPVAMVGDGVNDAPALAAATVGVAMGAAGTDVALETADIVLMSDDLSRIPYAIALSRHARRVVIQNLAFSIGVIVVLALSTFGLDLALPLGVVGHEGSTVLVCLNGLRLLAYRQ